MENMKSGNGNGTGTGTRQIKIGDVFRVLRTVIALARIFVSTLRQM